MTVTKVSAEETFAKIYNDLRNYPRIWDVAQKLGLSEKTVRNRSSILRAMHKDGKDVPVLVSRLGALGAVKEQGSEFRTLETHPTSPDEPVEELLERAIRHNERYATFKNQKSCIDVKIKVEGPYGVVGIPDHHLNSVGTLLKRAFDDAHTIADHPALYCVGIGDWLDNFIVGKLERERRKDVMSHGDAWRLLEHYLAILAPKMVAGISGNHMDWSTGLGGVDIMKKHFEDFGLGPIYDPDQVRVRLTSPDGNSFTHIARHKYRGNSRFNSVHAITVWILENWQGEDVVWGGHIHVAGHTQIEKRWMGESRVVHGVQLGTYKIQDDYAARECFRPNQPFLTPMTIHIPETGETLFFADMYRGIEVLDLLRKKAGF
jgi:hypothetical protein